MAAALAQPASTLYVPPSPDPNNPNANGSVDSNGAIASMANAFATDGVASLLRLTPSETSGLATSVETLRDLFWTLYSKLDAVLQGFRVGYEVAARIAEVRFNARLELPDDFAESDPRSDETSKRPRFSDLALATFSSLYLTSGDRCSSK